MSSARAYGLLIVLVGMLLAAAPALAAPPAAPFPVNAQKQFANTASVTTAADPAAVRYELHRSTSTLTPPGPDTLVLTCAGAPVATGCSDYTAPAAQPGTYYYALVAVNAAGERSAPSAWSAAIGMAFDPATAPAPAIPSPAEGASVSGVVAVNVAAADPDGVNTLLLYADGVRVNVLSLVSSGTIAWDTTALTNGDHVLTLLAVDQTGVGAVITRHVTVANARSTSLVASYGFDWDASAATIGDDSGNAHAGTAGGNPAWDLAGRNGRALAFDGVDDAVSIGSLGSFMTKAFTIDAWVKRTSTKRDVGIAGSWSDTQGGGPMLWIDHLVGDAQLTTGLGSATYLDSGRTLTTGAWQHVAATYDGQRLRYFLDGTEVAARAYYGAVGASTAWMLGSYAAGGDHYFRGSLDDVRIYKRALTDAEIAADRDQPTRDLPATPAAPQLSTTGNNVESVKLSWAAVAGAQSYVLYRSTSPSFVPNGATRLAAPATPGYTDTLVSRNVTYYYAVTAVNAAGASAPSNVVAATVQPDVAPPVLGWLQPAAGATVSGVVRPLFTATDTDNHVASTSILVDGHQAGTFGNGSTTFPSWDSRTVANGPHTLALSARDGFGNTATTDPVTVTVDNHGDSSGAGLMASYELDEGAGTTAADGSGFKRDGTPAGADWTPDGHRDGAIALHGGADRVELPALGSAFYQQGLTLEAWVKPTASQLDSGIVGTWTSAGGGGPMLWVDHVSGHYRMTAGTGLANYVDFGAGPQVGVWQHLAATYDGAQVNAYLDGTLVATKAVSPATLMGTANTWRIGAYGATPGNAFKGVVDEVRIYGRPLSLAEVRADMDGAAIDPADGFPPTTPTQLAAGTPATTSIPLTWTASTDDKAVKDYLVYVGATKVATVTDTRAVVDGLLCGHSYQLGVAARDTAGKVSDKATITASAADCPPREGLVAAYSFDAGDAATEPDLSGREHVADLVGATRAAGHSGQALALDGSGRADLHSLGRFYNAGFTLEAWVRSADTDGRDGGIVGTWSYPEGGPMLWLGWQAGWYELTLATGEPNYVVPRVLPSGWQHLAATYDGAVARFYVNGAEVTSKAFTGDVGSSDVWRIGAYGATPGGYFRGLVDDVRIYSRALSAGEVANDMAAPVAPAT